MNRFSVDKIEMDLVELIDNHGLVIMVKLEDMPQDIKEGDILIKRDEKFFFYEKESEKKKEEISKLLDELFEE